MRRFALLALVSLVATPLAAQSPMDQVGWLAGCWQSVSGPRTTLEFWSPADGGLMLGGSRTVAAGQTRAFEHLRLRRDGELLVYTALPSGQKETEFRSTSVSDTMFVVENPAHDFPTKISYRRVTADSVVAVVQGPGPNGMRGFAVGYGRVKCEGK